MHEIFQDLSASPRILDVGGRSGSIPDHHDTSRAVILDIADPPAPPRYCFNRGDAGALPFRDGSFDIVVANHSLEHIDRLDDALREIGRVAAPGASLFASVPDSSTVSDKLYRWLGRGGGHVNPFPDPQAFAKRVEAETGLPFRGFRLLHSGYSFLNRETFRGRGPRRLLLLGGGREWTVRWWSYIARRLDRLFGSRLSVYGWAFYFGAPVEVEQHAWTNVCIRCGSGVRAEDAAAEPAGLLRLLRYRCSSCGAENLLTLDD